MEDLKLYHPLAQGVLLYFIGWKSFNCFAMDKNNPRVCCHLDDVVVQD